MKDQAFEGGVYRSRKEAGVVMTCARLQLCCSRRSQVTEVDYLGIPDVVRWKRWGVEIRAK